MIIIERGQKLAQSKKTHFLYPIIEVKNSNGDMVEEIDLKTPIPIMNENYWRYESENNIFAFFIAKQRIVIGEAQ